jgi:hypothetical protein
MTANLSNYVDGFITCEQEAVYYSSNFEKELE